MFNNIITWITLSFKMVSKSEYSWVDDAISGKNYVTITYLCVTTVPFVHDD